MTEIIWQLIVIAHMCAHGSGCIDFVMTEENCAALERRQHIGEPRTGTRSTLGKFTIECFPMKIPVHDEQATDD